MKILIAEDDVYIGEGLHDLLSQEGYSIILAGNGVQALEKFQQEKPEFVILDIMMPEKDGYSVCKEIRRLDEQVPVIFLSAKAEEIDRVVGLELGADDYITKPFGTREVIARIRAVTRRYFKTKSDSGNRESFGFGDLQVFPAELRAKRGDEVIDLSLRDIKILELFFRRPGEVITRDQLFDYCWGYNHIPNSRTLDQHISKLRKRLQPDAGQPPLIQTVYGAGYRYDP